MAKAAVRTDQDGRFMLDTERVLTPFRGSGWFAVQLTFEHPGYERFLTNYPTSTSAPTPKWPVGPRCRQDSPPTGPQVTGAPLASPAS